MVAINADTADIPSVNFGVQGSDITAPGASRAQLYVKSSGVWYILNGGTATRLADNPLTTAGDLVVSGASGLPSRLAVGADGDVLQVSPSTHLPVWSGARLGSLSQGARVTNTQVQSIPNGAGQPMVFDTEDWDTDGLATLGTNNDRLTVQHTGYYLIVAGVSWATNAAGLRFIRLVANGVIVAERREQAGPITCNLGQVVSTVAYLAASQTIQALVYQNSGNSLNTDVSVAGANHLAAMRVG